LRSTTLDVTVLATTSGFAVRIGEDTVRIDCDTGTPANRIRQDFAAWLALPVAMRRGRNLLIHGAGSEATAHNAARLAEIWSRWLPGHFRPVAVRFTETWARDSVPAGEGDLCFYSGGVDSTYALLKRWQNGHRQALLTVHGMDYRYADHERFTDLLDKTAAFAARVGTRRILVRTNVYDVYKKFPVNRKGCDVGHAFALAGMAFLYSEQFGRPVIAADLRLDQQFDAHPWGTNTGTNRWFDDSVFRLATECDDVTRAEKGSLLADSPEALRALTFCVDYASKPHNCGRCQKCVRTKAMFMAATGRVPEICLDLSLLPGCLDGFDLGHKFIRACFLDLYETALRNGTVSEIPGLAEMHQKATTPSWLERVRRRLRRFQLVLSRFASRMFRWSAQWAMKS